MFCIAVLIILPTWNVAKKNVEDNIKEVPLTLPVSPQQKWVMKNRFSQSKIKRGFLMLSGMKFCFSRENGFLTC